MAVDIVTLLEVAEMYYIKDMNQQEISEIVGVSRPSISRMLEEARKQGLIKFTIEAPIAYNKSLAERLQQKFKLKHVIVTNSTGDYKYDMGVVGRVSTNYIESIIKDKMIIGITWGKMVENVVEAISNIDTKKISVVQLNGSLGTSEATNKGIELVMTLAHKLKASYEIFSAPAYVDSKSLQRELLNQKQLQSNIEKGQQSDLVFGGIGNLEQKHNTLLASGALSKEDIELMESLGVVGHMMGRMFDIEGKEVEYKRIFPVSNELSILSNAMYSVAGVVSKARAKATLGAINGKLINVLICDEKLAKELLKITK